MTRYFCIFIIFDESMSTEFKNPRLPPPVPPRPIESRTAPKKVPQPPKVPKYKESPRPNIDIETGDDDIEENPLYTRPQNNKTSEEKHAFGYQKRENNADTFPYKRCFVGLIFVAIISSIVYVGVSYGSKANTVTSNTPFDMNGNNINNGGGGVFQPTNPRIPTTTKVPTTKSLSTTQNTAATIINPTSTGPTFMPTDPPVMPAGVTVTLIRHGEEPAIGPNLNCQGMSERSTEK